MATRSDTELAVRAIAPFADVPRQVAELYAKRALAIRAAAAAGLTVSEIAGVLGVGRQVVYDALEER